MDINKTELGNRIKAIRKSRNMTLEEFGREIGAGKSNVSKWEKSYVSPNEDRLKKIAHLGKMSVNELLYGDTLSFVCIKIAEYLPKKYAYLDKVFEFENYFSIAFRIDEEKLSLDDSKSITELLESYAAEMEEELISEARQYLSPIIKNLSMVEDIYRFDRTGKYHQSYSNEKKFITHLKKIGSFGAKPAELVQSLFLLEDIFKELQTYIRTPFQMIEKPTISLSMPVFLDNINLCEVPMEDKFVSSVMLKSTQPDNYSETVSIYDEMQDAVYVLPKISYSEKIDFLLSNEKTCFVVVDYQYYCGKLIDETHLSVDGAVIDISNNRFISRLLSVLY